MTVSTTNVSVSYAGDGTTVAFPITFQFGTSADLSVVLVDADGNETAQALTTHYTVSQSASGTGTLTMLTAPPDGYTLRIDRDTALTQPDSLRNQGAYYPATVEGMVNRTVRQAQEVKAATERSLRLPRGTSLDTQLTDPIAGSVPMVNSTRTGFTWALPGSDPDAMSNLAQGNGSALVGFLQSGTGAVARTMQDKLREVEVSVKDFGAVGDGVTDDTQAIQLALNVAAKGIYFPAGTYRVTSGLTKVGSRYTLHGDGPQVSIIQADVGTFDVLTLSNPSAGDLISRVTVRDLMFACEPGEKTAGALIRANGVLVGCLFDNLYLRHFYDGFYLTGTNKAFFTNIAYDQFGRDVNTKGNHAFNFHTTYSRTTDCHLTNIQGSGFVTGSTPESQMNSHLRIRGIDGLYVTNCHFFYADYCLRIEPDDTGFNSIASSVLVSNVYFDTMEISHVLFAGAASVSYQDFQFSNCLFRAAQTSKSVNATPTAQDVVGVKFTGCFFRDNLESAIYATGATFNAHDWTIVGCTFEGNNSDNVAVEGDVILRGDRNLISGNVHIGGGDAGHAVRILSSSNDNVVTGINVVASTATAKVVDGGTGTRLSSINGFVIRNSGTATITNPATSVTVNHGLGVTPAIEDISVNLTNDASGVTRFYITSVTATTFTIAVNAAPTVVANFSWRVNSEW